MLGIAKDAEGKILVKLVLRGVLERDDHVYLAESLATLQDRLLFLKFHSSDIRLKLDSKKIQKEFPLHSFPYELLSRLSENDEDREALHLAYDIISELKEPRGKKWKSIL